MDEQVIRQRSLEKFDRDAPVYEQTSDGRFCSRAYPAILKKIGEAPFSSLLDVGCGPGTILSEFSGKARLFGIDLSAQMIERAKAALNGDAELAVGDAEALPWPEESFDAVLCTFSFHHYPNPEKALAEMGRVLKPGGRLMVADPWMPAPLRQLFNAVIGYSRGGDCRSYSKREMKRLLENAGLKLMSFEHPTNDSFLLSAGKAGGD